LLSVTNKHYIDILDLGFQYKKNIIPNNSPILVISKQQIKELTYIFVHQRFQINYRKLVANWANKSLWDYKNSTTKTSLYDKWIYKHIKYYEINNMKFANYQNFNRDLLYARCIFLLIKKCPTKTFNNNNHFKYKYIICNLLIAQIQGFNKYLAQYLFEFIEYENNKKKFTQCLFKLNNNCNNLKLTNLDSIYWNIVDFD